MPFSGLEIVTANKLNGLISGVYYAVGSGTLAGPATNGDIPSAVVNVTTTTTGATYAAFCVFDIDLTGATTSTGSARLAIDGSPQSPLAVYGQAVSTDRLTVPQNYSGALGSPDTYEFKLVASPVASQQIQGANCTLLVITFEAV